MKVNSAKLWYISVTCLTVSDKFTNYSISHANINMNLEMKFQLLITIRRKKKKELLDLGKKEWDLFSATMKKEQFSELWRSVSRAIH